MQQNAGLDELTLARLAQGGDPEAGAVLMVRVKKCITFLIRQRGWWEMVGADAREEDLPSEAALRLLMRVQRGFDGTPEQFRSYLYRTVASVCSEAVARQAQA